MLNWMHAPVVITVKVEEVQTLLFVHIIGGQRLARIAPSSLPSHHSGPATRDFQSSISVETVLRGYHLDVQGLRSNAHRPPTSVVHSYNINVCSDFFRFHPDVMEHSVEISASYFSELNLVTDNLSLYLCSSQLRSQWKKIVCFLLRCSVTYVINPYNGISLKQCRPPPSSSGSHSCLVLPHFQGALHLCCSPTHPCPPKYLLFQLNLKIINVQENHKKLVPSVIISYILDGAVCSGAFENSLVCNNYVNHSNSGSRLTDTPEKRPYTILRIVRLVPNVFTYVCVQSSSWNAAISDSV